MRAVTNAPDVAIEASFTFMVAQPMRRVYASNDWVLLIAGTIKSRERQSPDWRAMKRHSGEWRSPELRLMQAKGDHGDFRRIERAEKTRTAAAQRRTIATRAIAHAEMACASRGKCATRRFAHLGFPHRWARRNTTASNMGGVQSPAADRNSMRHALRDSLEPLRQSL